MREFLRGDEDGCGPVVMALVIVLLGILFLGTVAPVGPPPSLGVSVSLSADGTNWTLTFTSVPTGLSQNQTTLTLISSAGATMLGATTLYQLEGAGVSGVEYVPLMTGPTYTSCSAGDRILILTSTYVTGSQYVITYSGSILASGMLQ